MSDIVAFSQVADIIRGVTFDKAESRMTPAPDYFPILRAGNIQSRLDTDNDLIWIPAARVTPTQRLRIGDIAVAVSSGSSALVGKSALLLYEWTGSVGAFCAIVRPKPGVSPSYLASWLRSPAFNQWRVRRTRGANIQNLQISELVDAQLPLPSLDRQVEIASSISQQMSLASMADEAVLEQVVLARRLVVAELREHFGAAVPITNGPSIAQRRSSWTSVALTGLARLESGHTPSRRHPEWWGGTVPWLALPDISKLHGKVAHATTENINDAGLANSSARLLPVGTVCVSRTASIGFVTMLGRPMATSQDFADWVCDPARLDPEFLMYAFMASQEHLRELGSGAVHKTIYMPTIQSFHVTAPSIEEQRRIARTLRDRLAAAEALATRLRARQAEIECLPQRLLAAAFGEAA